MEDFGIFYGHLVYCMAIWFIEWPFGLFYGHLVFFTAIWYISLLFGIFFLVPRKIWQPCSSRPGEAVHQTVRPDRAKFSHFGKKLPQTCPNINYILNLLVIPSLIFIK
jgi:hypothetical protein